MTHNYRNNGRRSEEHVDPQEQTPLASDHGDVVEKAGVANAVEQILPIVPKGLGDVAKPAETVDGGSQTSTMSVNAVATSTALASSLLTMTHEEELDLMVSARKILAEQGVDEVQKLLKTSIAKTKKYETEVTVLKKKVEKLNKSTDEKRHEMQKLAKEKEAYRSVANTLLESKAKLDMTKGTAMEDDESKREEIKKKYLHDVEEVAAKLDAQNIKKREMEAENIELEKEFTELKAAFDQKFAERLSKIKEKENESKDLISELTNQLAQSEINQKLVKSKEMEMQLVFADIRQAEAQIKAFSERQSEFDAALQQSADVQKLASSQKEMSQKRLKQFEDIRKEDEKKFLVLSKELADLRREMTHIRQKLGKAEKNKQAAEKKSRLALEAQKKKNCCCGQTVRHHKMTTRQPVILYRPLNFEFY